MVAKECQRGPPALAIALSYSWHQYRCPLPSPLFLAVRLSSNSILAVIVPLGCQHYYYYYYHPRSWLIFTWSSVSCVQHPFQILTSCSIILHVLTKGSYRVKSSWTFIGYRRKYYVLRYYPSSAVRRTYSGVTLSRTGTKRLSKSSVVAPYLSTGTVYKCRRRTTESEDSHFLCFVFRLAMMRQPRT